MLWLSSDSNSFTIHERNSWLTALCSMAHNWWLLSCLEILHIHAHHTHEIHRNNKGILNYLQLSDAQRSRLYEHSMPINAINWSQTNCLNVKRWTMNAYRIAKCKYIILKDIIKCWKKAQRNRKPISAKLNPLWELKVYHSFKTSVNPIYQNWAIDENVGISDHTLTPYAIATMVVNFWHMQSEELDCGFWIPKKKIDSNDRIEWTNNEKNKETTQQNKNRFYCFDLEVNAKRDVLLSETYDWWIAKQGL